MKLQVGPDKKQYEMYQNADYQSFWEGLERQKLDELERILVQRLLDLPARRLIDIGCGFGRLADCYLEQCDEVVLLDSSLSLLQEARQKTGGRAALYIACDLQRIPFCDAVFDRVMLVRVLHHLPDSGAALSELGRILNGGGRLLFTYCNKRNLERMARWLVGRNPYNPWRLEPAWVWEAFFMHHPRYIRQQLAQAGFERERIYGAGIVDKLAGRLGRWGRHIPPGVALAPVLAGLWLAPWIFCQATRPSPPPEEAQDEHRREITTLLRCLDCGSGLLPETDGLHCPSCRRLYPLQDGIFNFLPAGQEGICAPPRL